MKKLSLQEITLAKIARSIEESWTLEQLISTEQFLALYYSRFDFQCQYLQQEWLMDNHIREKKHLLTALEGAQSIVFDPQRPSLKRLESVVKKLSIKEFQAQWSELSVQLAPISAVEMSLYPNVCSLMATMTAEQLTPTTEEALA